jgi:hypothetical protein
MCNPNYCYDSIIQQLITTIVDQKIVNGELFTAYDISKCVQDEEKAQGLPFTRHLEIKHDVHNTIDPHLLDNGGTYARTLIPVATPRPWLYHPQGADPMTYIPFGQTQPIGQNPQGVAPTPAPQLLPSGIMQPAPADDGDDDGFDNRSPDARGTLCVPSQLLHEAGMLPGNKVVVVAETCGDQAVLIVRKQTGSDTGLTEYTVDSYGNVRMTAFTLTQGKLPGPLYSFEGKTAEVYVF